MTNVQGILLPLVSIEYVIIVEMGMVIAACLHPLASGCSRRCLYKMFMELGPVGSSGKIYNYK